MAQVGEIVARFRAETSDYLAKIDQAKQKNRELAKQFVETAGSADKAIATLQVAKKSGELGTLGLDPRQIGGVIGQIKAMQKELGGAKDATHEVGEELLRLQAKRAAGMKDLFESFEKFGRGDFLGSIRALKKGLQDLEETKGVAGGGLGTLLGVAAIGVGTHILAEMTDKARELVEQYREGTISAGEMTEKLASSIPILGSAWQIGRNIREIITGENHLFGEQVKLLDAIAKKRQEAAEEEDRRKGQTKESARFRQDLMQGTHNTALRAAGRTAEAEGNEILNASQKQLDTEVAKIKSAADEAIASQNELMGKLMERRKHLLYGTPEANSIDDQIAKAKAQREKIEAERDAQIKATQKALSDQDQAKFKEKFGDKMPQQVDAENRFKGIAVAAAKALTNNPVADWIKRSVASIQEGAEEMRKKAASLHEALKSPFEKMRDELAEAISLKDVKLISPDDLKRLFQQDVDSLTKQRESLMEKAGKHVYDLPEFKELRGGQALFQTPTQGLDQKQLDELKKINDTLDKINQSATDNGIVVNEVQ